MGCCCVVFFFNATATTEIYTLSLHDALPILKLTRILLAGGLLVSLPLSAQTTYTYTGMSDNNADSQWDVATNWDLGIAPGALLNGGGGIVLDDIVVLRNNEGNGTSQRIRMVLDAGTIGSLEIGGIGTAGSTGNTQLQLRSSVSVDVRDQKSVV